MTLKGENWFRYDKEKYTVMVELPPEFSLKENLDQVINIDDKNYILRGWSRTTPVTKILLTVQSLEFRWGSAEFPPGDE